VLHCWNALLRFHAADRNNLNVGQRQGRAIKFAFRFFGLN
jgi:hypothetical protein